MHLRQQTCRHWHCSFWNVFATSSLVFNLWNRTINRQLSVCTVHVRLELTTGSKLVIWLRPMIVRSPTHLWPVLLLVGTSCTPFVHLYTYTLSHVLDSGYKNRSEQVVTGAYISYLVWAYIISFVGPGTSCSDIWWFNIKKPAVSALST